MSSLRSVGRTKKEQYILGRAKNERRIIGRPKKEKEITGKLRTFTYNSILS